MNHTEEGEEMNGWRGLTGAVNARVREISRGTAKAVTAWPGELQRRRWKLLMSRGRGGMSQLEMRKEET